jgi:hypothetical protein
MGVPNRRKAFPNHKKSRRKVEWRNQSIGKDGEVLKNYSPWSTVTELWSTY